MGSVAVLDCAAGEWTSADPLPSPRAWWGHSDGLLRLPGGGIVAIGGEDARRGARAEVYRFDEVDGGWTELAPLATARRRNSATVLADGRILVAGGLTGPREYPALGLATAELYDPATGAWTPAGTMAEPRFFHHATLLPDGRVLLAGGSTTRAGGYTALQTAELYDPDRGLWTRTEHYDAEAGPRILAQAREVGRTGDRALARADGSVLVAGTGRKATLRVDRAHFGLAELADGRVLVTGGVRAAAGEAVPGSYPLTAATELFRFPG
ncbi:hypothetical protein M8C13_24425 [Crossiella sp. SN42]|uniref:Kelch repeat-containing protein n=1 Tax=Crossiella sp. SN42 TaxID=2944808 RepID=UPI00207CE352|nr:kelch repeat-containing protein [Crossiella sp. SN42]MCO1578905.1 hypothetical protein [Crossiella sp. SN42]